MRFGKGESGQPDVSRPGSNATSVRVVETHISTILFVGERVYKMRKPVQFEFLDFRHWINRRMDCEREVTLNRRLAPDAYLGVADLVLEGKPIDHMVVKRRMPETRCLAALAREGDILDFWLYRVAEALVPAFASGAGEAGAGGRASRLRQVDPCGWGCG